MLLHQLAAFCNLSVIWCWTVSVQWLYLSLFSEHVCIQYDFTFSPTIYNHTC